MTINNLWQKRTLLNYLLLPLAFLFKMISLLRKFYLQFKSVKSHVPIIVVGNISVGGNGKTPVLIALANYLTAKDFKVAIISRGYQSKTKEFPKLCHAQSCAILCGDEPVMIARKTLLPVMIDPNRPRAIKALIKQGKYDVILSDDGLQHYAMARDIEICVIGSKQALGNKFLLPAGPLREPISRLQKVDFVIGDNSLAQVDFAAKVSNDGFYSINNLQQEISLDFFKNKKIYAVSGIALPERFHNALSEMNLNFEIKSFPDHYNFKLDDFKFLTDDIILMTEKDHVKCNNLNLKNAYFLKIKVELEQSFLLQLFEKLNRS